VGGRPLCPVGGLQAREWPAEIQIKAKLFSSSPLRDRGKKMNSVVQNDTVLLSFFFFLMYETASFWRKRAVLFECGARTRQIPNQPLIIFFFFNYIPANFGLRPSCWPRFSL